MADVYTNLASTQLAAPITASDTTMTVLSGDGNALFPSPTGGDIARCVLFNKLTGNVEIVAVTARSADVLTITRAYEGIGNAAAIAYAFSAGDIVELRPTAGFFTSLNSVTSTAVQGDDHNYAVDSGVADQYAISLTPNAASYASPMRILFKAGNNNTGASTLNVDGLGAKDIKLLDGSDPAANDITDGNVSSVIYDDTDGNFKLLNPRVPINPADFAKISVKNVFGATQVWKKGSDLSDTDIDDLSGELTLTDDGNHYDVNGTETIKSISAVGVGAIIRINFENIQTIEDDGTNLVLPGDANITTTAGDEAVFIEYLAGQWKCIGYTPKGDKPHLLDEDEMTSNDAKAGATQQSIKAYVDNAWKESSDVAWNENDVTEWSHGLSAAPKDAYCVLKLTSAVGGFAIDDEIVLKTAGFTLDSSNNGNYSYVAVSFDDTKVYFSQVHGGSETGIRMCRKDGASIFTLNDTDCTLRFVVRTR